MRPGKHTYAVIQKNNFANQPYEMYTPQETENYYIHKEIVDNREEAIPPFYKKLQNIQKERLYDHAKSVFRDWKPDTVAMINKCLEHDFKYWKTANFIKNPDDNEAVKKVITENIVPLKKVFHYLMASSVYPGIGWNDYSLWAGKIKIPDEKTVQSKVDMAFTAVNVQIEKIEGNSNNENSMCRF